MISGIIYWEGSKYNWQVKTTSFPEVQLLENPMCPDVQSRKLSASGWHWTSVSTGYSWNSPWSSTSLWLMELISAPPVIRFRQKNSAAFSSKLSAHTVPQLPPILTIGGPVAPPIRCSVGSPHLISLTWWIGSESSYIIHLSVLSFRWSPKQLLYRKRLYLCWLTIWNFTARCGQTK